MKGAITEPSASISNPPKTIIVNTIGASQSFFRILKNFQISFKISIRFSKIKMGLRMNLIFSQAPSAYSNKNLLLRISVLIHLLRIISLKNLLG